MRAILIGMVVAAGVTVVGAAATLAAPTTGAVISQAAAESSPVTRVMNGDISQYHPKKKKGACKCLKTRTVPGGPGKTEVCAKFVCGH